MADGRRVALITGASYGVGAASALALARDGFDLVLTATKAGNLDTTLQDVRALYDTGTGGKALGLALDLCDQASIDAVIARSVEGFGRIDVLVNNAGTNLRRLALETSRAEWVAMMDANLTGTFFLTQAVGRHLVQRQSPGRIVTISSSHALVGAAERSAYGVAKAGLIQMTRMLAIEWAPHGITVNAVAPGRMITASPSRAGSGSDDAYMAAMLKRIPLGRFATAEEVGGTVAFLAGPSAATITGQTIVIDGGLTAA
ncbi:MAG TPA: SDR family NAD(P)-dependent oxidoreductase [Stellaceae bacterium]|nr:SDR family NAD(P)-dependent oxidoreductase [Stellaceae bacterium]